MTHLVIDLPSQVTSYYKLVATKPDGSQRVLADWFPNLVTNAGLNHFGAPFLAGLDLRPYRHLCCVGSGTSAPSTGDTSLDAIVASEVFPNTNVPVGAFVEGASPNAPYYGYQISRARFAAGVAVGNLSEVGVGPATTNLFSRARILDNLGSPTTITVLADEILDVFWQVRQYYDVQVKTYNITIDGVPTVVTCKPAIVTAARNGVYDEALAALYADGYTWLKYYAYPATLGGYTQEPASTLSYPGSTTGAIEIGNYQGGTVIVDPVVASYTANTYYRDITAAFRTNGGNFDTLPGNPAIPIAYRQGIGAVLIKTTRGSYQLGFEPGIAKDDTKRLDITLRISWARRP